MKIATARPGRDPQFRAAILLAGVTLVVLLALAHFRSPWSIVWGDEGTFLAMMASLAGEGDLRFDERDLARLDAAEGGSSHLILQRDGDGVAYSKPILYAVSAAPFYAVLGELGPIVFNLLVLAFSLGLGFAYLRRLQPEDSSGAAALVLVTFTGAAVVLPYLAWRMTDGFQGALSLSALILCLGPERGSARDAGVFDRLIIWRGAPVLGAVLLGALASLRVTNALIAGAPILAALLGRRLRRAGLVAGLAAASYLVLAGLTLQLTGAPNPYRAARTSFTEATGYPAGAEAPQAMARFEQDAAADRTGLLPHFGWRQVAYASGYFFFGRHTGLVFYFPAAMVFLIFAMRFGDRISWASVLAFGTSLVFFIGWRAENYFGGDTFIGNRYFLSIYPLLLIALPKLPSWRWLATAWTLAFVGYGSALVSVAQHHSFDVSSQSHTRAGLFRWLPYESTSRSIVGRRDRYWNGHFVRFVDPFAEVGSWHFDLQAGRPPAELLVANWRPLRGIRLWVDTSVSEATLEVEDWRHTSRYAVGAAVGAAEGTRGPLGVPVDLEVAPAWRRHRYWWHPTTLYATRDLRMRLVSPDGAPATARILYFGDLEQLEKSFNYQRIATDVPTRVAVGTRSEVRLTVRNTSSQIWEAENVLPVRAGYRLFDSAQRLVFESGQIPLPAVVKPFREVELAFEVAWPEEPGPYRFEVDLALEHIAWFADRVGAPVIRQNVAVARVAAEDAASE